MRRWHRRYVARGKAPEQRRLSDLASGPLAREGSLRSVFIIVVNFALRKNGNAIRAHRVTAVGPLIKGKRGRKKREHASRGSRLLARALGHTSRAPRAAPVIFGRARAGDRRAPHAPLGRSHVAQCSSCSRRVLILSTAGRAKSHPRLPVAARNLAAPKLFRAREKSLGRVAIARVSISRSRCRVTAREVPRWWKWPRQFLRTGGARLTGLGVGNRRESNVSPNDPEVPAPRALRNKLQKRASLFSPPPCRFVSVSCYASVCVIPRVLVIEGDWYARWRSYGKLRGAVLDDGDRTFARETDCSDGRSRSKGMSCAVIIISKDLPHGKISRFLLFFSLFFSPGLRAHWLRGGRSRWETFARALITNGRYNSAA